MGDAAEHGFVSRGGVKLAAALDGFGVQVAGLTCVDLGCNVGGFTDCLLQRGAAKVYAVDTGYGALAWKLRNDPRVVVMERCNAMRCAIPDAVGDAAIATPQAAKPGDATPRAAIDLAVIDLGWTVQRHAIAAALRWRPRRIVTLIKPHYEATGTRDGDRRRRGAAVLDDAEAERIVERVLGEMSGLGVRVIGSMRSPIRGGAGKGHAGNAEWLALVEPVDLR